MRLTLCLCVFASALPAVAEVQQSASLGSRVSGVLARMASPDLETREAAFDDMVTLIYEGQKQDRGSGDTDALASFLASHPDQADRVKLGLINLLNADNGLFMDPKTPPGKYTEGDTEHYAEVVDAVSVLNDERAIPALVGAMTTGGMAVGGLLKYGQKSLGPVLEKLGDPNPLVRSEAINTAVTILLMKDDAAAHARILALIQPALKDNEFLIRSSAIFAIERLKDREQFMPALEELAQHDPFKLPGKADDGGELYPIRLQAKRLLDEIAKHGPPVTDQGPAR